MAYSGGALNELNGKMGISAPGKSVPVMKLIRMHSPRSKEELVALIEWHFKNHCECGVVSHGTIASFGKNLYHSQLLYWKEYRFTLQQCMQWEFDLFITQSLKGGIVEKKAMLQLKQLLPQLSISESQGFLDEELRIDLLIQKNLTIIGGIQIKPLTFLKMRREVILYNRDANKKWGKPVLYMYYDEQENFIDLDTLVMAVEHL